MKDIITKELLETVIPQTWENAVKTSKNDTFGVVGNYLFRL